VPAPSDLAGVAAGLSALSGVVPLDGGGLAEEADDFSASRAFFRDSEG
jgi:hypothetical protein